MALSAERPQTVRMRTENRSPGRAQGRPPTVLGGALGECVHVAGIYNFLRLAQEHGWRTIFLGPAVSIGEFIGAIQETDPDLVALSYRLTPETGETLLRAFRDAVSEAGLEDKRFCFGGTPPVVARARALGWLERCFDGTEPVEQVIAYLRGDSGAAGGAAFPDTFVARLEWKRPFPLIRHHFGLPTVAATEEGIRAIAEAQVLDVISLGTDQDAQEHFFHPERQDPRRKGAGGVPVRSADDFRALYAASRTGNYPLMRTYAGTTDLLRLSELYQETIHNAWCAVPLFWFNAMDGRGPMPIEESIRARQETMAWHGERDIPVELNEPHHWGMRDAPDTVYCASAFLSAYNARAYGVGDYLAQFMFNSPPSTSDAMDLAKMLACLDLIEPLAQEGQAGTGRPFRIYRQTRTGLLSYPTDLAEARGQLAASVYLQMALRPHVIHVVGFTEADHEATAAEVIEGCRIARRAIRNALEGQPDPTHDPRVQARREELVAETRTLLEAIAGLAPAGVTDPWSDATTLARSVHLGLLDAPQLKNNRFGRGEVVTRVVDGACVAVDPQRGEPWPERARIAHLLAPARLAVVA
ncbi:MAG TPA: cobalamin-dependent protein [Chloroflexota bacterium]|nr:cobalamin-dependent protein [Chloroflexota bacterium]